MEKGITAEQNLNALRWTYEAGLRTVIQMVIGMPGETEQTIRETTEFIKKATDYLYLGNDLPSSLLSINYAQALPGTPLYEYARQHGFIGRDIDEEERYLFRISDTDAYKEDHFVNYTGLPLLKVLMWQKGMAAEVDAHYLQKKYNTRYSLYFLFKFYAWYAGTRLAEVLLPDRLRKALSAQSHEKDTDDASDYVRKSGYFNIRDASKFTPLLLNPFTRYAFTSLLAFGMAFGRYRSGKSPFTLLWDYYSWRMKRALGPQAEPDLPTITLRKVVQIVSSSGAPADDRMMPLRSGR
jgi:hypothetical protein